MTDIIAVQYGRTWWNAYDAEGRFLASGRTKREAIAIAKARQ